MISGIVVDEDDAGFPTVAWTETRGFSAPGGAGAVRVECRIMKHGATGVLLFVVRGRKRVGAFEAGEVWENLERFSLRPAAAIYQTPLEQLARNHLAQKGLGSKLVWTDSGQLFHAEFKRTEPLHVNYAEASQVELDRLHIILTQEFILRREDLVRALCEIESYKWPLDDDRVPTFDPNRSGWPGEKPLSRAADLFAWVVVLGVVGAVGAVMLRLLGIV